ncbi:hypothetical protein [Streptomyces sp. MUM 16J]|uniref:hypothetical protein n=1 Tax=Streptomyces sp. MUM 16J TaxID=2791988 RepID=UPI001F042CD0|nr:hypothetical protein [Streptomyces sp. MUM 16J]MCH0555811.1 hypothetical protein [Streptomyces sp. MUM 16J]
MHDRVAELAGLRAELAICRNGPRESRRTDADGVQEQIDRVRGELREQAERLEKEAEQLLTSGHDGLAGQAAEEAQTIREALDAGQPAESPKRAGKRTAAAGKAPESRGGGA